MKNWNDLLWLHLTGQLHDAADRQAFDAFLNADDSRYRDELAEWQTLEDATTAEISARVDALPPLSADFLASLPDQRTTYSNGHTRTLTVDGSRSLFTRSENDPMIRTPEPTTITHTQERRLIRFPRVSLPMIAAITAVIIIGGLLFLSNDNTPPDTATSIESNGGGDNDQQTMLLTASPTHTATPTLSSDDLTQNAISLTATATTPDASSSTMGSTDAPEFTNLEDPIGCETDNAIITSPAHAAQIFDPIAIRGTAFADDFGRYIIAIREPDTEDFTPFEISNEPVNENSILGQFFPGIYDQTGPFDIRLTVFDTDNVFISDCRITVVVSDGPTPTPVPSATFTHTPTLEPGVAPVVTSTPVPSPTHTFTPTPIQTTIPTVPPPINNSAVCTVYTVAEGDTLSSIAADFDVNLDDLIVVNRIDDEQTLQTSDLLIIPTEECTTSSTNANPLSEILCTLIVSVDGVRLRAQPANTGEALAFVAQGQMLEVMDFALTDGMTWYRVQGMVGDIPIIGYIREDTVTIKEDSCSAPVPPTARATFIPPGDGPTTIPPPNEPTTIPPPERPTTTPDDNGG